MRTLQNSECLNAAELLAVDMRLGPSDRVWGVPRGGIPSSYLVSAVSGARVVNKPENATVIIDDLLDSGSTANRYTALYPNHRFGALFAKDHFTTRSYALQRAGQVHFGTAVDNQWLVFPWEDADAQGDVISVKDTVTRMLQYIGEDPNREGLLETPERVVKAWGEWFKGYKQSPEEFMKTFEDGAEQCDEMVLLTDIPIYSHCEHHVTPFIGVCHVAYLPNGKIVGLSKIARVVEVFSRRLQVQERLTNQIADCLQTYLQPLGVAVVVKAKHFCMATRGVKMPNVDTTTSALRGVFHNDSAARAEFFSLIRGI